MTDRPAEEITAAADALVERCVNSVVAGRRARRSDAGAAKRRPCPDADLAAGEEGFETFLLAWLVRPPEKRAP